MPTSIQLFEGDCASVLTTFPQLSIDLVVTSPPYDDLRKYKGFSFDFEPIAAELVRVLKPGGVIVWVVNDATVKGSETGSSFRQALHFMSLGLNLHDTMIYHKKNVMPITSPRYQSVFEYMFVFSKGKPSTFNTIKQPCVKAGQSRQSTTKWKKKGDSDVLVLMDGADGNYNEFKPKANIWSYSTGNTTKDAKYKHPAKFPIQLALDHIESWSNPGDIVLDPFLGSGTTGIAARKLGREFIGIEISKEYLDMARDRFAEHAVEEPKQELKIASSLQGTLGA